MPDPAVGMLRIVERVAERQVRPLTLGERRALVDDGADERVSEADIALAELHEPGALDLVERRGVGAERGRGPDDDGRLGRVVGGGEEHQRAARLRDAAHAVEEGRLDRARDGQRVAQRGAAGGWSC